MQTQVSGLSMAFMAVSGAIGFFLPLALVIYFKRKKKADLISAAIGAAVMVLFAFVLERAVLNLLAGSPLLALIGGNFISYSIYGGLMAALFEETGRYLAMRFLMKKQQANPSNALMYGAGHGGIEAVVVLTVPMINNLIYSALINRGMIESMVSQLPEASRGQMQQVIEQLVLSPAQTFLLGGMERISAILLQICLSMLVWLAVIGKKSKYFGVALIMHFLVDTGLIFVVKLFGPIVAEAVLLLAAIVAITLTAGFFAHIIEKGSPDAGGRDKEPSEDPLLTSDQADSDQ